MLRRIIYFAFCCLCFIQAQAQQIETLNKLIDIVEKNVTVVLNDTSLNASCKTNLEAFRLQFPRVTPSDLNEKYLTNLREKAEQLLAKNPDTSSSCNTLSRANLAKGVNNLVSAIGTAIINLTKKPITDKAPEGQTPVNKPVTSVKDTGKIKVPEKVSLQIKIIDSASGKLVNGHVEIDSAGRNITLANKSDTAVFRVLLFPVRAYRIKVSAETHNDYTRVFNTSAQSDSLLVKLQMKKPVETEVVLPGVSLPNNNVVQGSNNVLTIGTVGIIILALLVIVLLGIYLQTLKRLKLVNKKLAMEQSEKQTYKSGMDTDPQNEIDESNQSTPTKMVSPGNVEESIDGEDFSGIDKPNHETAVSASAGTGLDKLFIPAAVSDDLEKNLIVDKNIDKENSFTSGDYFVCELMMTAGPRKNYSDGGNNDKDIGEDVCGFVSSSNDVFIWLLDGTSDSYILKNPDNNHEYFSSRLLALGIADKLRKYFVEQPSMVLSEMILPAIKEVKANWLELINNLPAAEKLAIKNTIEKGILPDCSTTLLFARLSLKGQFDCYRTGDSKMFLFDGTSQNKTLFIQTPLVTKNDDSNDRIFFRLKMDDQQNFDIIFNQPLYETFKKENISTIITFSDGIGAVSERLLREEYTTKSNSVLKDIMYQSQETADDKTICFIEIKERIATS